MCSIPNAIDLVTSIANKNGWPVTATEDSSVFTTPGALDNYTTMAFLHTTGDFLVEAEFDGLYQFLINGGSWLGIHSGLLVFSLLFAVLRDSLSLTELQQPRTFGMPRRLGTPLSLGLRYAMTSLIADRPKYLGML